MKDEIKQQIEDEIKKEGFEIDSLAEHIFKKGIEKGYNLAEKQSDAVEFAKWIRENAAMDLNGKWLYYQHPFMALNNEELYELFKQSKEK
jgi:hypothetical protein